MLVDLLKKWLQREKRYITVGLEKQMLSFSSTCTVHGGLSVGVRGTVGAFTFSMFHILGERVVASAVPDGP